MNGANLAELPADIILQILQYFAGPRKGWHRDWPDLVYVIPTGESLRAIQSVRLTCRSLSQVAIPVLFPVLRVAINHRSINAFDQLTKSPGIAAQARGVQVNVATFSGSMATELKAFKDERVREMSEAFHSWSYRMENLLHKDEEGEEIEGNEEKQEYERVDWVWRVLLCEWEDAVLTDSTRGSIEPELDAAAGEPQGKFGEVLLGSHKEYARRHREQIDCVNDAQAIERLAKAFLRLGCKGKIHLSVSFAPSLEAVSRDMGMAELFDSPQTLFNALVQPHEWADLYRLEQNIDLEIVKILSKLPIALADAGVQWTELYLGCFPHYKGFTNLLLNERQPAEELEKQLWRAFQNLQVFNFGYGGMNRQDIRHEPLPESDLSIMRAYLRAAVASPQLQKLAMDFYTYAISTGRGLKNEGWWKIGTVLQSIASTQLTRVSLAEFEATSAELLPLLARLGTRLSFFYLYNVLLLDGSWAPMLDAIRESTAQRWQDGLCWAKVASVFGAEYEPMVPRRGLDNFTATPEQWREAFRTPLHVKKAKAYIRGRRSTNPLRIVGEDTESDIDDGSGRDEK